MRGYNFPSATQKNFQIVQDKYNSFLRLQLKKGRNKVQIFIDPISKQISASANEGNLQTPFG